MLASPDTTRVADARIHRRHLFMESYLHLRFAAAPQMAVCAEALAKLSMLCYFPNPEFHAQKIVLTPATVWC